MIWPAANLSRATIGDYWDDVDQYTRNHLVEHQLPQRDLIEAMVAAGPEHRIDPRMATVDRVIERTIRGKRHEVQDDGTDRDSQRRLGGGQEALY